MHQFVIMSLDVAQWISNYSNNNNDLNFQSNNNDDKTDVVIANLLQQYAPRTIPLQVQGISVIKNEAGAGFPRVQDYVAAWDQYKDSITVYQDPTEVALVQASSANVVTFSTNQSRVLMGIFTTDTPAKRRRRDAIRRTYLSYYNNSYSPRRICSLNALIPRQLSE